MEGDDTESSARIQKIDHIVQGIPKHFQLPVQFDPDSLKGLLCRMSFLHADLCRDRRLDNLHQFTGGFDRLSLASLYNVFRDVFCKFIFSVITYDPV